MADQKIMKKRLKALMNLPENQICSDCTERQPRWASLIVPPPGAPPGSLPIGAFCCLECSGSHRRLGVHIAFVRSINLDSWKEKEVLAMENGGNAKVNAIFEATLARSGAQKPSNHADGPTRERFIRDKYERRKFYDPNAFSNLPEPSTAAAPAQQRQQAVGPPSDAARQRIEERQQRLKKSSSTASGAVTSRRPASTSSSGYDSSDTGVSAVAPSRRSQAMAKAPISAPVPSMDLLDLFSDPPAAPAPVSNTTSEKPPPSEDPFHFMVVATPDKLSTLQKQQPEQSRPPASQDIMLLYNKNTSMAMAHMPQQQPMMTSFGSNNNMFMAQQPSANAVANMTAMMGSMNFHQLPPQQQQQMMMMMQQQQQQQLQMMMMQQQQQHMMQQQRGGMPNNNMGMMMPQQQTGMHHNTTMASNGNAMMQQSAMNNNMGFTTMQSSSHFQMNQKQNQPEKEDPFAQFGHNAFRS